VPPPLTLKTGVRLVVEQSTQLDVLDVDTGRLTRLARDPDFVHYDRLDVLATGGQLVMVGDNNTGAGSGPFPVYGTTAGPRSKLRPLGQEASSLMPSAHRGRVWLVADNETSDPAWGETLLEVDVRGVVRRRATFVHWFGVQPFGSGFLRTTHLADGSDGPDTELVDERGRRQRLFPGQGVLAVYGTTAVLGETMPCDKGPCRLRVLTAGVPLGERAVALAEKPQTSRFRVNPAGTRLLARNPRGGLGPADVLSEIDLRTGESRPVEAASADGNFFGPQFSADGRWMLFVDGDRAHIDAFDLRERHAYRVKGTFSRFTQITVLD
jgi:hypothetical protein